MERNSLEMPILGLFGEVGSLLSALKKKQRDALAYTKYDAAILEELGDTLWYFTRIASRAGLDLSVLAQRMSRDVADWDEVKSRDSGTFGGMPFRARKISSAEFGMRLVELGGRVGDLVKDFGSGELLKNRDKLSAHLVDVFRALVTAAEAAQVPLDGAARGNLLKIFSRWPVDRRYPPPADRTMPSNERLPARFTVFFEEHAAGGKLYVLQKCNGVIIGDRLTDNKTEKDDYRFHDVFHMAYAVHLGWSPVLRALLRLKRKSLPEIDENQDGARAILTEEGVSTFIFQRGLERGLFANLDHVDYDLLKLVQEFVGGYEVERCALWQWEKAILDGFRVFRELKERRRGYVTADLSTHVLKFKR